MLAAVVVVDVATACAAGKSGFAGACVVGGWAGGAGCGGISPPIIGMGAPGMPPWAMNGGIPMAAAMWWCGAMGWWGDMGWCGGAMPGGMPGGAKGGMPGMGPIMAAGCMAPK